MALEAGAWLPWVSRGLVMEGVWERGLLECGRVLVLFLNLVLATPMGLPCGDSSNDTQDLALSSVCYG